MGGIPGFVRPRLLGALVAFVVLAWPATASAERVVALLPPAQIAVFGSAHPESVTTQQLTGATGELWVGLDIRPADGKLYAFGVNAAGAFSFFLLDPDSGALTSPGTTASGTFAVGGQYGTDFNPLSDRLRVVNSVNQNVRMNPNNGAVAFVDTSLSFNAPAVGPEVAVAYSNNFVGTPTTTLFGIDRGSSRLVTQNPPNNGSVFNVGPLGVTLDPGSDAGLDISGETSVAYAAMTVGGVTSLYTVDLASGTATPVGPVGSGSSAVASIAVGGPDPPLPTLPPSNQFSFGKLKRNTKKGTATLAVSVPGPGSLDLTGKGVKAQRTGAVARLPAKAVTAAGTVKLKIVPKGKTKKKLSKSGSAKVKLTVTFTPTGGAAASQKKTVKLKKRP
jgi:hypothetical protein